MRAALRKTLRSPQVWLITGIGVTILGVAMGVQSVIFLINSEQAVATVVDVRTEESSRTTNGGTRRTQRRYFPTVEFENAHGQRRYAELATGGTRFRQGSEIPIRYNAEEPYNVRWATFRGIWQNTIMVTLLGIVLVGLVFGAKGLKRLEEKYGPRRRADA